MYTEMLMSRSPFERSEMVCRMFDTARFLVEAGIKHRNPNISPARLRTEVFLSLYRQDFSRDELRKIISQIPNMELDPDW
jgi:hypothetical protein